MVAWGVVCLYGVIQDLAEPCCCGWFPACKHTPWVLTRPWICLQVNKMDWLVWNVVFLFVLFLVSGLAAEKACNMCCWSITPWVGQRRAI